ncbi:MAG: hypothetical protein L0196_07190 [candidate division Zixibacteria bacterium]|nr:hypothetical protein [candidate division Zixibacteria bacterium]
MHQKLNICLQGLRFGEPRRHERLTVLPLFSDGVPGPNYVTLSQALAQGECRVTEVDEKGSVPNLKVENNGDRPVLLLDAEELVGAKQNRVLNTTILVRAKSTTFVPVSCTEAGRWSYTSPEFADARTAMYASLRHMKMSSVSASLKSSRTYGSNQQKIWEEIALFSAMAGAHSPTGAMHEVYRSQDKSLEEYEKALPLKEGQQGLLVLLGNRVVGLDYVSRPKAFAELYPKLLKSYALDALFSKEEQKPDDPEKSARDFFEKAASLEESIHPSVAWGDDYRFTGEGLVGSALEVEGAVIHLSLLRREKPDFPKTAKPHEPPAQSKEQEKVGAKTGWRRWFGR